MHLIVKIFSTIILFVVLQILTTESVRSDMGLMINIDSAEFFITQTAEQMSIKGLNDFVDQFARLKVSHLFFCPNAMKTSYRSKAWEAIWDLKGSQRPPRDENAKRWVNNSRNLHEHGIDPFSIWISRCRGKKISPWLSVRMNDVHNADDIDSYIHNSFWREHPDYWRVPYGSTGSWVKRALDFSIPQVREYYMSLIRELLERYNPDGLELDWMRFPYYFKSGKEGEGCEILTKFMKDIRSLTKEWSAKRGHAIMLGARVPVHPDVAKGLGMDGVRWVREGIVDMLVPTPFFATADFDIPIELWLEHIKDSSNKIIIAAGQERLLRAYPDAPPASNNIESLCGFSVAHLYRGANQIYLFNYMDINAMLEASETYRLLREKGFVMEEMIKMPRRHVVTYHDTVTSGVPNNVALPVYGFKGGAFHIYIGPSPRSGKAHFIIGLEKKEDVMKASFDTKINENICKQVMTNIKTDKLPNVFREIWFECPVEFMKNGYNSITLKQSGLQKEQKIIWAELRID